MDGDIVVNVTSNITTATDVYNTTSATIDPVRECSLFSFIIYGPFYGTICIFGLVGNALSFAVLHRERRSSVSTYLLKALAVTDNLFLVTASLVQIVTAMAMYFKFDHYLRPVFPYVQGYLWPFTHMTQMGTVWMTVLVAANRYIAVCMPLKAPALCTMKKVRLQILIMCIAIFIYNIPRFFEYRFVMVDELDENNVTRRVEKNLGLQSHRVYNIVYENLSYCVFVFLTPLLILVIFNYHLVHELKEARKSREALTSRYKREENNITLVMVVIIITFIICQTPASINQILFYVLDDSQKSSCLPYDYFFHISNLLILTNSSINFFIYCVFRRQFRHKLYVMCCGKSHSRGLETTQTSFSPRTNYSIVHEGDSTSLKTTSMRDFAYQENHNHARGFDHSLRRNLNYCEERNASYPEENNSLQEIRFPDGLNYSGERDRTYSEDSSLKEIRFPDSRDNSIAREITFPDDENYIFDTCDNVS